MADLSPGTLPPSPPSEDRLESWKAIATYLKRDVTTVQRWEKREGMPVRRHLHDRIGTVYASRAELDSWVKGRNPAIAQEAAAQEKESNGAATVAAEPIAPSVSAPRRTLPKFVFVLASAAAALAVAAGIWLSRTEYFWRNPIADAKFQTISDFEGVEQQATISRDGQFVAFLSDRDGPIDVWVTQIGSGQFHNLTHGSAPELVNPSVRVLGFSPDGTFVTYWARKPGGSGGGNIGIWAIPTLGGQPKPYLDGVGEFDWSHDASRLVYHTPGAGDPLFVSDGLKRADARLLCTAPAGLHSHFPVWSQDGAYIYFVRGSLPDQLDIWRIAAAGGTAERITSHSRYVGYPVLLSGNRLMYLASDADGSGPWLYGMDLTRRNPHRLTAGPERYTSLAASADGRRAVVTLAAPRRTLWRMPVGDLSTAAPARIASTASGAAFPRFGPNYLIYVSSAVSSVGSRDRIWKFADGLETELWSAQGSRVLAAPAISADGLSIAFSVRENDHNRLYAMRADGTNVRVIADSVNLEGTPAWAPDGRTITSAVTDNGTPRLYRFPVNGSAPALFGKAYSLDPVWAPDGRFAVYSGADVGTTFSVEAMNSDGTNHPMHAMTLTRGARHVVFTPDGRSLVLLRGEIRHKDLWSVDLTTGAERELTRLPADFDVSDFDLSRDGREVVLERLQERSDVVLLELGRR